MSNKLNGWKKSALAVAAVAGFLSVDAYALSLGPITVQSSLGEPLRAEIQVFDLSAEVAASIKAVIASPGAFNAAGLKYNPIMPDLQVRLQWQVGGRAYIALSSERLINEPYIDLLLDTTWASGHIIRDYTLLFDPPSQQKIAPLETTPPPIVITETREPTAPEPVERPPAAQAREPVEVKEADPDTPTQASHKVKLGETAYAIALRNKPANVSLEQMLVALVRANPDAFIAGNVNRMKTGVLLTMPSAALAQLETSAEASQILVAQSLDFNEYRRQLAAVAPKSSVVGAGRQASGTLQAKVEDKKLSTPTPDKLTLSKGSVQETSTESRIASELAAKDSADRAAELAKNISDLRQLSVTTNPAALPPPSAASSAPSPTVGPSLTLAPTPGASAPVDTALAAKNTSESAPKSVMDWVEELTKNPYAPVGALGLLVAVISLGVFRHKQHNRANSASLGGQLVPEGHVDALKAWPLAGQAGGADLGAKLSVHERAARDLDFDRSFEAEPVAPAAPKRQAPASLPESTHVALPDLNIHAAPDVAKATPQAVAPKVTESKVAEVKPNPPTWLPPPMSAGMADLSALEFDIGSLSLDLDELPETPLPTGASLNALETKLALAHEFYTIGDARGAQALLEEVIAEAVGPIKTQAEQALRQLKVG